MDGRQGVDAGHGYVLLVERLREIADALDEVDGSPRALARSDERRSLLREQAYLLSAVAGLDGGEQSLN
jgi:hypothetical protein